MKYGSLKQDRKKNNLYLNLFDAKSLITEQTPFLLYENVQKNKGILKK